jgi:predicted DNA-binding transcriptional regulator AlpA
MEQNFNSRQLMTLEELATFLNVPKSWVYNQTRTAYRTGFPVLKVGKYCRFDQGQVLQWLNNGNGQQGD